MRPLQLLNDRATAGRAFAGALASSLAGSPAGIPADSQADALADAAVEALIDEATLTPKPGLVDLRGNGAHEDLNWLLMCRSARALRPAFHAMALAGQRIAEPQALREYIGAAGRDAERAMMQATGGVNTHRGAIWALGLIVTAAAQPRDPGGDGAGNSASAANGAHAVASGAQAVAARAGALARLHDPHAPAVTGNKGALACLQHGVGGARSQAQQGFPQVMQAALPMLRASRLRGDSEECARLNALLAVMAELDDTCLLARGGRPALEATQRGARGVLDAGGTASSGGRDALRALDADLLALRVSPGGAADLLAAALLLDRIETQSINMEAEYEHGTTAI
jgi:triphosphoribosyl-dephospho-CoA synthase